LRHEILERYGDDKYEVPVIEALLTETVTKKPEALPSPEKSDGQP